MKKQSMTIEQFLKEVRKLKRWKLIDEGIRYEIGASTYCPITRIARVLHGDLSEISDAWNVGRDKLGIAGTIVDEIVVAADYPYSDLTANQIRLRKRLLRSCGLKEKAVA